MENGTSQGQNVVHPIKGDDALTSIDDTSSAASPMSSGVHISQAFLSLAMRSPLAQMIGECGNGMQRLLAGVVEALSDMSLCLRSHTPLPTLFFQNEPTGYVPKHFKGVPSGYRNTIK